MATAPPRKGTHDPRHPPPAADLTTLLAHGEWIRSLARALVGDPHAAEDLAQEAIVVALERPPRHATNPRGWLARVLRNLARQRHRRGSGRGASRVDEATLDARPPTLEVVERAEVVLELREDGSCAVGRETRLLRTSDDDELAELGGTMPEHRVQAMTSLEDRDETVVSLGAPSAETVRVTGYPTEADAPIGAMMQWIGECDAQMERQRIAQTDEHGFCAVELHAPGAWYVRILGEEAHEEVYLDVPATFDRDLQRSAGRGRRRLARARGGPGLPPAARLRGRPRHHRRSGPPRAGRHGAGRLPARRGARGSRRVDPRAAGPRPRRGRRGRRARRPRRGAPRRPGPVRGRALRRRRPRVDPRRRRSGRDPGHAHPHGRRGSLPDAPAAAGRLRAPLPDGSAGRHGGRRASRGGRRDRARAAPRRRRGLRGRDLGRRAACAQVRVHDLAGRSYTGLRFLFDAFTWQRYPFDSFAKHAGPLPAGTYVVSAHVPGRGTVEERVSVTTGEVRAVTLRF